MRQYDAGGRANERVTDPAAPRAQRDNSSPFEDDESLPYTLDSTYWDPSSGANTGSGTAYEPPENMFGASESAG